MAALTSARSVYQRFATHLANIGATMDTGATGYRGGMAAINTSDKAVAASADDTLSVVGWFNDDAHAGELAVISRHVLALNSGTGADLIRKRDIGKVCYVIDDQTVGLTSASGARPRAGTIADVDDYGVWVSFL